MSLDFEFQRDGGKGKVHARGREDEWEGGQGQKGGSVGTGVQGRVTGWCKKQQLGSAALLGPPPPPVTTIEGAPATTLQAQVSWIGGKGGGGCRGKVKPGARRG